MANTAAYGYNTLADLIESMRSAQTDLQNIEVKEAAGGTPKTLTDSVSALANGSGGLVILGLSERNGFVPAEGFVAKKALDALADMCADKLEPPVRAQISIDQFEGANIVVADIPETSPIEKPCFVKAKGMYKGSFIRTGDGDRLLTPYEINRFAEERTQPKYDLDIVEGATVDDLDEALLSRLLKRQKKLHPRIFGELSRERMLEALNITVYANKKVGVTLAGLLALGTYPQHFEPRLTVTFAFYEGSTEGASESAVPADTLTMAGPIPYLIFDTVEAVKKRLVQQDSLNHEQLTCFLEATREAVCNALMHRDYSPLGRGSLVQVNLYADRLEVISPGGLYGAVTAASMDNRGVSSTRNKVLAALLETTEYPSGGLVTTNSGESFAGIKQQLTGAGLPAPEIVDKPSYFMLTLRFKAQSLESFQCARDAISRNFEVHVKSTEQTQPEVQYLRGSTLNVYRVIYELGCARTSDVVEKTGMPRSTVSYAIKRLVNNKLIEVVGEDVSRNSPQRLYRAAS